MIFPILFLLTGLVVVGADSDWKFDLNGHSLSKEQKYEREYTDQEKEEFRNGTRKEF